MLQQAAQPTPPLPHDSVTATSAATTLQHMKQAAPWPHQALRGGSAEAQGQLKLSSAPPQNSRASRRLRRRATPVALLGGSSTPSMMWMVLCGGQGVCRVRGVRGVTEGEKQRAEGSLIVRICKTGHLGCSRCLPTPHHIQPTPLWHHPTSPPPLTLPALRSGTITVALLPSPPVSVTLPAALSGAQEGGCGRQWCGSLTVDGICRDDAQCWLHTDACQPATP
jgi:hypothetical protein